MHGALPKLAALRVALTPASMPPCPHPRQARYKPKLEADGADLVVPLCHLYEPQDERTARRTDQPLDPRPSRHPSPHPSPHPRPQAREFDFPIILSGHDHHVVDKVVEGSRILKPGLDGIKAIIIDVVWHTAAKDEKPTIAAETVEVARWAPDASLQAQCVEAYKVQGASLDPGRGRHPRQPPPLLLPN